MTAIVIGATGLVGSELTRLLSANEQFERIKVFIRRPLEVKLPKVEEYVINFDRPEQWKGLVNGDILFSALGTTLKQAGSKGAQFKVDYKYQYNFAKVASDNGVPNYILISAAGASSSSRIFYSRIKGNLEKDVKKLLFQYITILRPGLLTGNRKEKRMGEQIGFSLLSVLHHIPGLKSLKPIHATTVAQAMINSVHHHPKPINEYSLLEVFKLAAKGDGNKQ
jgi:uncharacterized protein YbjT (DUF2867 family)